MPRYIKKDITIITIDDAFEAFMKNRQAQNLSPRTMKFYKENYGYFKKFIDTSVSSVEELDIDLIEAYTLFMQNSSQRKATSINTALRGLKALVNFCIERKYIQPFKISMCKTDKVVKQHHTNTEIKKLLETPRSNKFTEWRNYTVIQYLLATGNRVGTIVELKVKNVDFDRGIICIDKNKNRKGYELVVNQELAGVLKTYLSMWDNMHEDYLFPSQEGRQLTVSGMQNAIKRYCKVHEIDKKGVHIFRYTFARKYIEKGGSVECLSHMLGHSSVSMTRRYLLADTQAVRMEIDNMRFLA